MMAPTSLNGETPPVELFLDITVNKQRPGLFFASINNVTDQIRVQRENFINAQHLKAILARVEGYVILTLDAEGVVTGCSERVNSMLGGQAVGQKWQALVSLDEGEAKDLLLACQKQGWLGFHLSQANSKQSQLWGDIMLTVVSEPSGALAGYSVIVRNADG